MALTGAGATRTVVPGGGIVGTGPTLRIQLPAARPDVHVRWVEFGRAARANLSEDPSFETVTQSIPFSSAAAAFLENSLSDQIESQALAAAAEGRQTLAPVLSIPRELLDELLPVLTAEASWLGIYSDPERVRALGVDPPDEEMLELFHQVIAAFREALSAG
jgi:hypothetical protein